MATKNEVPLRVFLWIMPRTNSTVFTKCMSFVDNTEVWMEPYNTSYLNDTIHNPNWGLDNPAIEKLRMEAKKSFENLDYQETRRKELEKVEMYSNVWVRETFSFPWVKKQLEINPEGKQLIFIKDQSFAINDHLEYLPDVPTRHVFLIRHPMELYPSFKNLAVIKTFLSFEELSWDETSLIDHFAYVPIKKLFEVHRDLWRSMKKKGESDPIIIDGYDLVSKPDVIIPKFLAELGIPYKESYLKWDADPERVYSTWKGSSEFVYFVASSEVTSRAVESTHFVSPTVPRGTRKPQWKLTEELKECVDYAMPFYEEMYKHRLI